MHTPDAVAFASCSLLPSRASGADADGFLGEAAERYRGEPRERRRRPRRRGLRRRRRRGLLERAGARKGRARSFGHQVSRGSDRAARGGGRLDPRMKKQPKRERRGGSAGAALKASCGGPAGSPGTAKKGVKGKATRAKTQKSRAAWGDPSGVGMQLQGQALGGSLPIGLKLKKTPSQVSFATTAQAQRQPAAPLLSLTNNFPSPFLENERTSRWTCCSRSSPSCRRARACRGAACTTNNSNSSRRRRRCRCRLRGRCPPRPLPAAAPPPEVWSARPRPSTPTPSSPPGWGSPPTTPGSTPTCTCKDTAPGGPLAACRGPSTGSGRGWGLPWRPWARGRGRGEGQPWAWAWGDRASSPGSSRSRRRRPRGRLPPRGWGHPRPRPTLGGPPVRAGRPTRAAMAPSLARVTPTTTRAPPWGSWGCPTGSPPRPRWTRAT